MLNNRFYIIICIVSILSGGCATVQKPAGFLSKRSKIDYNIYGKRMNIIYHTDSTIKIAAGREFIAMRNNSIFILTTELLNIVEDTTIKIATSGELIAIQNDSIYLLSDIALKIIPIKNIVEARLVIQKNIEPSPDGYMLWTVLGILSTLPLATESDYVGHGCFALISAPFWLITGIAVAASRNESYERKYSSRRLNKQKYSSFTWQEMSKFARFPQGIPNGLKLS